MFLELQIQMCIWNFEFSMLCLIIFKKSRISFKKVVIVIAILFLQFVKLQVKNSTNIIIVFEKNAKLYTILSIFWILIRNWSYIDIKMKSKSMKIKFQNAISKMHIKKVFELFSKILCRKRFRKFNNIATYFKKWWNNTIE